MSGFGEWADLTGGGGTTTPIKCEIMSAPDVDKEFTWTFVNGFRKVSNIQFTSASVNAAHGQTITLNRAFTYQLVYPFDLISIIDTLTQV